MRKVILRFGTMFLTFTFGLAGSSLINRTAELWIGTPDPLLEEPWTIVLAEPQRLVPLTENCSLLVVEISNDRSVWLGELRLGNLDNSRRLVGKLNEVFALRTEARAYRPGFDLNTRTPEEGRIENTVLVRAPREVSYGEVSDLVEMIRATGAKPIGLVTETLFTSEQNRATPCAATLVHW